MRIVYIAHPIGGDVAGNLACILNIVRQINLSFPQIVPLAPYMSDVMAMDDNNPEERERGINNDLAVIASGAVKEVWLFGRIFSEGMKKEARLAKVLGIPVYAVTKEIRAQIVEEKVGGEDWDFIEMHREDDNRPLGTQFRESQSFEVFEQIINANRFKS